MLVGIWYSSGGTGAVGTVDDGDLNVGASHRSGGEQAPETTAHDHDAMPAPC
jgi:hypothetical protein